MSLTIWNYCSSMSIYCVSHVLPTYVKLVVWTLQNINNFTWTKITPIIKRRCTVEIQIVSDTRYHIFGVVQIQDFMHTTDRLQRNLQKIPSL